ncbi:MAG: hypothetical protein CMO59_02550 [Verrucomicrobiales bacterium]|nr:hypothetical protein [Verrucomicrobiales bacterium]MEE2724400.1 biopolymer transporter ExbD [Verrucomicrobiota bacterium]|tara:strand:+ start:1353 stop:1799 length:447 start_codon:yes stop_codon:yes gene_type:complete
MRLESTLRSRRSFLHLASLIDIVFLLLLFFLLSSDAIVRSGIAVRTPSWEENEDDNAWALMHPVSSSNVITVSAGSTSQVYLNDRLVDLEELLDVSRLKAMLIANQGADDSKQVVVRADNEAHFGTVIRICNRISRAGYSPIMASRKQ